MATFKDLRVWQEAVDLAVSVVNYSRSLPRDTRFELGSQLVRAALSVPSNIAEGHGRLTMRDRRRFLGTSRGSLNEIETQLEIARRLGLLSAPEHAILCKLINEIGRGLSGLIRHAERKMREGG